MRLGRPSPHSDEVVRSDRRWLLVAVAVFVATLIGLFGAHAIYRELYPALAASFHRLGD